MQTDFTTSPLLTLWQLEVLRGSCLTAATVGCCGYVENLSHPLLLLGLQGAKLIPVLPTFQLSRLFKSARFLWEHLVGMLSAELLGLKFK